MTPPAYDFEVVGVKRVLDGDTMDLELRRRFDVGFGATIVWEGLIRARLIIVDTPEKSDPMYARGTEFTRNWIGAPGAKRLRARTWKPRNVTPDGGFGRWLTDVYDEFSGTTLSSELLRHGFVEYRRET